MSVNFLDSTKWADLYAATVAAQEGYLPNSYHPIPDIQVGTSSADFIAIAMDSLSAKPNWRLGVWVQFYVLTSFSDAVEFYRTAIPLRIPKVIAVPKIQPQYSIRISVPTWHEDVILQVKEYIGFLDLSPEERVEQAVDDLTIKVDNLSAKLAEIDENTSQIIELGV